MTLLIFGFILLLASRAEGLEGSPPGYSSDQAPPQITIINPLPDSVVDTEAPVIVVAFLDVDSDINLASIRLLLDRMDITAPAMAAMERVDGTETIPASSYRIKYQPTASLMQGIHEIDFSVRDWAGNLAEAHWSFNVKLPAKWGLQASGSNTLQLNLPPKVLSIPVSAVQNLDMTVQGQSQDTNVQLHLYGWAYADTSGYYYSHLQTYSLGIYHQRFALVLGCAGISLDSELLQNSPETGWVSGNTLDFPTGQYAWEAFSGTTILNSGLEFNVKKIEGLTSKWAPWAGWSVSGFALRLEGKNVNSWGIEEDVDRFADFTQIRGSSPVGQPIQFRYELIHGDSRSGGLGKTGNALALHLDRTIGAAVIGFDYLNLEPGYPVWQVTPIFSPEVGGAQKYTLRGAIPFTNGQYLSVDGSFAENNLDQSVADTLRRQNMNLGYSWNPGPDFSLTSGYSWDFFRQIGTQEINNITHGVSLGLRKIFNSASFQTSLTLSQTNGLDTGQISNQRLFSGSWTQALGSYNLIPTVNWTLQNLADGNQLEDGEFRITIDRQSLPTASLSSLALYRIIKIDTPNFIFKATTGIVANLYFKTWGNSNLTVSYSYNWLITDDNLVGHTDGRAYGCSLTWRWPF